MKMQTPTFKSACLAAVALLIAAPAQAVETTPLEGTVHLDRDSCSTGSDASQCNVFFEVHGAAAKVIYDRMQSDAKDDLCTGGKMKSDSDLMLCFATPDKSHSCYFGYSFGNRSIIPGDISC